MKPWRAKFATESELAKVAKSLADMEKPKRTIPKTGKVLPGREKLATKGELPE